MPTCKKCNEVVGVNDIVKDGVCKQCIGIEFEEKNDVKNEVAIEIPMSIKTLSFTSKLILFLSILSGIYIAYKMSYIYVPNYIGNTDYGHKEFTIFGITYGISIILSGLFFSTLGLAIVNIYHKINLKR